MKTIPHRLYLTEEQMPKQWYNVRADMKNKPAQLLNPATGKPVTLEELSHVFCTELAKQELDDTTAYFDIPEEILQFYDPDLLGRSHGRYQGGDPDPYDRHGFLGESGA